MLTGIIVAFLYQLFGPSPQIIVSEETTVITSPLRDDGLPDYQKYWRDLGREGVTHENNAAVLFWQAIWPGELKGEDRLLVSKALGFEKEPDSTDTLQPLYAREVRDAIMLWRAEGEQKHPDDESVPITSREHPNFYTANQFAEEVIDVAMTRPWTSEEIPPLADWIAKNEKPLSLLVEASRRPRWWSPSPSLLSDEYAGSVAVLLPDIHSTRDVARWFCLRAMWHAGEGRLEEAWSDLVASFHFARFAGEGPTLVGQFVAAAIDGITLNRTIAILQHGELDAALARKVLADLNSMEVSCDMVRSINVGERLSFADTICIVSEDSSHLTWYLNRTIFGTFEGGFAFTFADQAFRVDWNHAMREASGWYDRFVEAARRPVLQDRIAAIEKLDSEITLIGARAQSPLRLATGFLSTEARSSVVSDVMIGLMMPSFSAAMRAEDRAAATLALTRAAAALAVYRAEQGEYPETLDQLVPGVMIKVPDDLYSGKPFLYKRMPDGGYLLYSVFENGKDDGGTDYAVEIVKGEWVEEERDEADYENSDLVIRVPLPKFELPEMPELVE